MKELFTDVLPYLFGSGAIILFILSWIRFHKKDAGTVGKLKAEAAKTNAETQVLLTDGALRIADRLSADLDNAREEIEKLLVITAELKLIQEKTKTLHIGEVNKLKEANDLLEINRKHCIKTKNRIVKLQELLSIKKEGLTQEQLQDLIDNLTELAKPN